MRWEGPPAVYTRPDSDKLTTTDTSEPVIVLLTGGFTHETSALTRLPCSVSDAIALAGGQRSRRPPPLLPGDVWSSGQLDSAALASAMSGKLQLPGESRLLLLARALLLASAGCASVSLALWGSVPVMWLPVSVCPILYLCMCVKMCVCAHCTGAPSGPSPASFPASFLSHSGSDRVVVLGTRCW